MYLNETKDTKKILVNSMPENATIVSLLNSGILVYSSVFQETKIHNDFMVRHETWLPQLKGSCSKLLFSIPLKLLLPRS